MMGMDESEADREFGEAAERGVLPEVPAEEQGQDTGRSGSRQSKSWGWSARYPKQLMLCLTFLGLTPSCGPGGPEAAADRFMDSYYASANLGEALQMAEGLAAKKIQDQQHLLKGQDGPQTSPGRRVTYRRTEKSRLEGKLFFTYEVRIDVQGGSSLTRKSLLALSQGPNGWRVTNFNETD
jgi:hypothetical protein